MVEPLFVEPDLKAVKITDSGLGIDSLVSPLLFEVWEQPLSEVACFIQVTIGRAVMTWISLRGPDESNLFQGQSHYEPLTWA